MIHLRRRPSAFALVELLVVIGIITLLVGILLPTLGRAREQANLVVCQSNVRQMALAMLCYGVDNKGQLPGSRGQKYINLDWSGRNNLNYNPKKMTHPIQASVMLRYLPDVNVMRCPSGPQDKWYDYTMPAGTTGAKTNLTWKVSYPVRPGDPASPREFFQAIPLFVEEHDLFYQASVDDGSWANSDQFNVRRHRGKCSIAYLDGSVGLFAAPRGPDDAVDEPQDLHAIDLLVHCKGATYYGIGIDEVHMGWVNQPWADPYMNDYPQAW